MIRLGNIGGDVLALQKKLKQVGYDIEADGVFGLRTRQAVKAFQHALGIASDGVAGNITNATLDICIKRIKEGKPRTTHFKLEMFISPEDQTAMKYGVPAVYWDNVLTLMERLEQVRMVVGKPIIIRSGYRSLEYNKKVGGAGYSQHLYGKAADIYVEDYQISCYALARTIYDLPNLRMLFGGMGLGSIKNVHVDIRVRQNPKNPTLWWYANTSWKQWSRA